MYIEYWGLEDDPKYLARKEAKQSMYGKYGFNLIELHDKESAESGLDNPLIFRPGTL